MRASQNAQRTTTTEERRPAGGAARKGSSPALRQQTLKNSIHCSGIGLHSGARVSMTLHPRESGGIVFRRSDLAGAPEIAATWDNAVETPLCTTLQRGETRVATVEHLLSALAGVGIDSVLVELDGPEVPIMDGSAAPFVFLIECAGIAELSAPRMAIRVHRTVAIEETHRSARLLPAARGLGIDFEIDFDSPTVARQDWSVQLSRPVYKRDIARARTFGFLHEVDKLRESGLAQGGSLDNAVVIAQDGILNEGGLRYEDEFVRHKVLDAVGDLYLAGAPIIGRFQGAQSGHALNLRLVAALLSDPSAWSWTEMSQADVGIGEVGGAAIPSRAVAASA
jgi:UDP-3-O-[3-hydroxymyristoyl] N-acetylglucosamine deacetylase